MLDTITKRRIDTARDILVGKVPDPKSQVEQITIALIYKFMDDMDLDAEELGGEPSFFSGEYEKYGWRKIFNPSLGGFETLSLYSEAILKMAQNPNLPQLFRDIFKNAYLPYRDPETLKGFLRIINDFSYDHSEKLGDAFEYLLSVLGSQGDAGQFRTPRHVIDFMTALIAPKKNESVLDPACGTAGFLISAYKHILKENSSNYDQTDPYAFELNNVKLAEITVNSKHYKGDKLSPADRSRIIQNIKGYDISPDMVRLSLVNLYLHGFTDPHIHEYDTLTSEERWNEFYDVILANPPFMSPKGGIRPHKRFAVQSKRSEVLFVDYMAEHLTPTGKAAIIVPEGIIFQSGTAYKSLRKMLVEDNYLVGVISLPAGVFNPYSGVKTSILWLDKTLAKKTDKILFAKIENDGFDLGAQRRPIKQNDLPGVFRKLTEYRDKLMLGEAVDFENDAWVSLVEKEKIAGIGEFNLSGERYKKISLNSNSCFPIISLGKLELEGKIEFLRGNGILKKDIVDNGARKCIHYGDLYTKYNIVIKNISSYTNQNPKVKSQIGDVLVPSTTTADALGISIARALNEENVILGGDINIIRTNNQYVNSCFLAYLISTPPLKITLSKYAKGTNILHLSNKDLKELQIPLPPLSVQEEIVAEIESYQKIIDGARQVVENYKPRIDIDPEWELVELGEVAQLIGGGTPSKKANAYWDNGDIDWITCSDFVSNSMFLPNSIRKITKEGLDNSSSNLIDEDTLILVTRVSLGKLAFTSKQTAINQDLTAIVFDSSKVNKYFAYYFLFMISSDIEEAGNGVTVKGVSRNYVKQIKIPIPEIGVQNEIVKNLEKERELVNANKQLIEIFEQKIKDRIAKVWGD